MQTPIYLALNDLVIIIHPSCLSKPVLLHSVEHKQHVLLQCFVSTVSTNGIQCCFGLQ